MEYEVMLLVNSLGVGLLFAIAGFSLIGVEKEKNTDNFNMNEWTQSSKPIYSYHIQLNINNQNNSTNYQNQHVFLEFLHFYPFMMYNLH